jgi:hypothetical protein
VGDAAGETAAEAVAEAAAAEAAAEADATPESIAVVRAARPPPPPPPDHRPLPTPVIAAPSVVPSTPSRNQSVGMEYRENLGVLEDGAVMHC